MCTNAIVAVKQAAQPILVPRDPSDYVVLAVSLDERFRKLAEAFAASRISVDEWMSEFFAALKDGHADAHLIGQRLATMNPDAGSARFWGGYFANTELQYMRGFGLDLSNKDPRYWDTDKGEWREDTIHNRMRLYLGKTRGTAGSGFVAASPKGSEFFWDMTGSEHCADCPVLEEGSPYTEETLYTTPGAGDTPCFGNCECVLRRGDGVVGVEPLRYAKEGPYRRRDGDEDEGPLELDPEGDARIYHVPDETTEKEFYEIIRSKNREVIGAWRDGKMLFQPWIGDRGSVAVPSFDQINLVGSNLVHNHPSGSIFSWQDLVIASVRDVGSMVVVRSTGGQWVARAEDEWPVPPDIKSRYDTALSRALYRNDEWVVERLQNGHGLPSEDEVEAQFAAYFEEELQKAMRSIGVIITSED